MSTIGDAQPKRLLEGLAGDDEGFFTSIVKDIHRLLRRRALSPKQIDSMARLLLGLQRLPLSTPGLDITFALYLDDRSIGDGEYWFYDKIHMNEFSITLSSGSWHHEQDGWEHETPISTDSYLWLTHETNRINWLSQFKKKCSRKDSEIEIEDNSNCVLLDWKSPESGTSFWQSL